MNARLILLSGLLFALLAVILGAFGAHALRASTTLQQMQTWQTASEYHFYHALGLIALGIWMENKPTGRLIQASGVLLMGGLLLFSGSLYLLVLMKMPTLGMLTPFGGVSLIAGWGCWALALILEKRSQ